MNHYTNQSFRSLQLLNGEAINRIIDEATNGTCEDLHRSLEEWIFDGGRDNKKTYNALLQIRDDWDKCSSEKPEADMVMSAITKFLRQVRILWMVRLTWRGLCSRCRFTGLLHRPTNKCCAMEK